MPFYDYKCQTCGVIEILHGINEDSKTACPECNASGLVKLVSLCGGIIVTGREANQYRDIHAAKYWRDKNGVRHPVTVADGYTTSATVNRQTATPGEAKAEKKKDRKAEGKKRMEETTARAAAWNKEQAKTAHSLGEGVVTDGH